jgi:hypothetical protein
MRKALGLIVLIALAAFASTEFGIHGGLLVPTGDRADFYNASPMIGGHLLIHMPMYAIEGSVSYAFLSQEGDYDDWSANMVPVLVGIRTYSGTLFYGGGLAYHNVSTSYETEGGEEIDTEDGEVGAYGNIGTIVPMGGNDIELSGKLHWIDFDDFWLGATAGINL